ncbi:MAG: twin-arginine translocase TatA/TatE family subunit [Myxococcota bacterium]
MFGLGTWELALILVAALIFIGPNKLPDLARNLGKGMREMRRAMAGFEREVNEASRLDEAATDAKDAAKADAKGADGDKGAGERAAAPAPGAAPEGRVERGAPTSPATTSNAGASSAAPDAESKDA